MASLPTPVWVSVIPTAFVDSENPGGSKNADRLGIRESRGSGADTGGTIAELNNVAPGSAISERAIWCLEKHDVPRNHEYSQADYPRVVRQNERWVGGC